MYPNAKVLTEVAIFCPGGTDLLAGLVLDLLGDVEELLSSSEVLLVLGTRFLHGRTIKREEPALIQLSSLVALRAVARSSTVVTMPDWP